MIRVNRPVNRKLHFFNEHVNSARRLRTRFRSVDDERAHVSIVYPASALAAISTRNASRISLRQSCTRRASVSHGVATLEDADGADEDDGRYEEDLLFFLYFAQDAHFRRTTEESGINEYSGATERRVGLCTPLVGARWERKKERKKNRMVSEGGSWRKRETHGGGKIEDGREKMLWR